jgi:hypothetical protein
MTNTVRPHRIGKVLSANDLGLTGAHQAGMLIPKQGPALAFFPLLDGRLKNPRIRLTFHDAEGGRWELTFIYYNGGTRNEYRLTGMTRFLRESGLRPGDELVLRRDEAGRLLIEVKTDKTGWTEGEVLKLGSSWRVIPI